MAINTKYKHITNHTQLKYTIMQVNAARVDQEDQIKHQVKELYYLLHPKTLIKNAVGNLLHNPAIPKKLVQSGMAIGAEYLIGKIFKRSSSIKGFLTSMLVEKVADYALNSNSEFIQKGFLGKIAGVLKNFKS